MASEESLLKVCRLLNEKEAHYLIAGGFAVVLHQVPRFTADVDLSYRRLLSGFRAVACCFFLFVPSLFEFH